MNQKVHEVFSPKIDNVFLYLTVDGQDYRLRWADCSTKLETATLAEWNYFEISPSGYGIHWPFLDEELAINSLLKQAELWDMSQEERIQFA